MRLLLMSPVLNRITSEVIAEALRELDASALATKADLQELKVDLIKWMVGTHLAYGVIIIGVLVAIL